MSFYFSESFFELKPSPLNSNGGILDVDGDGDVDLEAK